MLLIIRNQSKLTFLYGFGGPTRIHQEHYHHLNIPYKGKNDSMILIGRESCMLLCDKHYPRWNSLVVS